LRIKDYISIGILIILTIIFFWKFFFLGLLPLGGDIHTYTFPPWFYHYHGQYRSQNPLLSDPVFLHYPLRKLATSRLKEGKITLWNPYIFCGTPLFSTNSVSYSPLNILFLFFDSLTAYSLIIIIQLLFCGIFMYIFLRASLYLTPFAALIGSITYEFSGFHIVWVEFGVLSGFLLPLILFLIDKAITKRNLFYASLAGLALGLQLLSTFLQMSLFVLLTTISYSLFKIFRNFKAIPHLFAIFIIGFSLSAVQLLPSYELIKHSQRKPVEYYRQLIPLPFQNLITFLVPNYYGNPVDYDYQIIREKFRYIFDNYGPKLPPQHPKRSKVAVDNYNEYCAYIGILPLILAILAIFLKRDKNTIFFTSFTIISLLLALGTPLYYLLYLCIPGCDKLTICRFISIYTFGVSVLAGLGGNFVLLKNIKKLYISIILLFMLIILVSMYLGNRVANYFDNEVLFNHFSLINLDFAVPILLLLISGIILLNIGKIDDFRIKRAIFVVVVFDLFYFGLGYNPFVPRQLLYPTTPSLTLLSSKLNSLGKGRIVTFDHILPVNINMIYGFESVEGYDAMFYKRYDEFMNLVSPYSSEWENVKDLDYHANRNLLCMLNTKYLLASKKIKAEKLRLIFDGKVKIYEDLYALPRAWVVSEAIVLKTKEEIFKELINPDFDPRKTVILEEEYKMEIQNSKSEIRNTKVEIIDYQPEKVIVKVKLNKDGFLVLSDTYYPGWYVFVDGRQEKLFCANYILRAVYLSPGEHIVEFRFLPASFKLGSIISISTLIILIFLLTLNRVLRDVLSRCIH
jgi:hypothetical protein